MRYTLFRMCATIAALMVCKNLRSMLIRSMVATITKAPSRCGSNSIVMVAMTPRVGLWLLAAIRYKPIKLEDLL